MVLALLVDHHLRPLYTAYCPVRVSRVFPGVCYPCIVGMSGARLYPIDFRGGRLDAQAYTILWKSAAECDTGVAPVEGILFKLSQPGNMLASVSDDPQDPSSMAALRR